MSKDLRKVRSEELEEGDRCVLPWCAFRPKGRPPDPPDKVVEPSGVKRGESR